MDADKVPTLAKNFPDVLLALLKRMSPAERRKVLAEFETAHPKDFKAWFRADVVSYLKALR